MAGLYNNMANVELEAQRLAGALGRAIEHDPLVRGPGTYRQHHVIQRCPLCAAQLGLWIQTDMDDEVEPAWMQRQLFALYDAHRCVASTEPFTVFERAERALVTAAERIGAVSDPGLRARAEAEADRMAVLAKELGAKLSGG